VETLADEKYAEEGEVEGTEMFDGFMAQAEELIK